MRPASSFREARRRQRRQALARVFRFVLAIAILIAAAFAGYEVGTAKSRHDVRLLEDDLEALNGKQYALEIRTAEALQRAEVANERWLALQDQYRANVPSGELKELLEQLKQKIDANVPTDRIRFVIDQLGRERNCAPDTQTKRFMLRTPVTAGVIETVALIDNTINLSGEGEPVRNAEGLPEAWFDVTKDVEIRFLQISGDISLAKGLLPLTHSIVVGEQEHIFIIRADEQRGFVSVTAQSCAYP